MGLHNPSRAIRAPGPLCQLRFGMALGSALGLVGLSIAGCRPPDGTALRKLACEQAAVSLDLQSVSQIDALRKALGVAPDVDPIGACRALGVEMTPRGAGDGQGAEAN